MNQLRHYSWSHSSLFTMRARREEGIVSPDMMVIRPRETLATPGLAQVPTHCQCPAPWPPPGECLPLHLVISNCSSIQTLDNKIKVRHHYLNTCQPDIPWTHTILCYGQNSISSTSCMHFCILACEIKCTHLALYNDVQCCNQSWL